MHEKFITDREQEISKFPKVTQLDHETLRQKVWLEGKVHSYKITLELLNGALLEVQEEIAARKPKQKSDKKLSK